MISKQEMFPDFDNDVTYRVLYYIKISQFESTSFVSLKEQYFYNNDKEMQVAQSIISIIIKMN